MAFFLPLQDSADHPKYYDNFLNVSPATTTTTTTTFFGDTLSPNNSGLDRPRHLSTITESQNSTTSTPSDSRRNSSLNYPKVDRIFENVITQNPAPAIKKSVSNISLKSGIFNGNSESDCPYYPLGSEASTRPFTPRFTVEEVVSNNYEPVVFGKPRAVAQLSSEMASTSSPQLPKRQARMALRALNLSSAALKEDFEQAMRREALNKKVCLVFII